MGVTVCVVLAIRFVMLFVIADEIVEGETVMRANALDRGPCLATARLKDFAGASYHLPKRSKFSWVAAPIGA
jgi:hypothetical protein